MSHSAQSVTDTTINVHSMSMYYGSICVSSIHDVHLSKSLSHVHTQALDKVEGTHNTIGQGYCVVKYLYLCSFQVSYEFINCVGSHWALNREARY